MHAKIYLGKVHVYISCMISSPNLNEMTNSCIESI